MLEAPVEGHIQLILQRITYLHRQLRAGCQSGRPLPGRYQLRFIRQLIRNREADLARTGVAGEVARLNLQMMLSPGQQIRRCGVRQLDRLVIQPCLHGAHSGYRIGYCRINCECSAVFAAFFHA
ncbi:hypothetical protein D3C81_1084120 [compost metagenome]